MVWVYLSSLSKLVLVFLDHDNFKIWSSILKQISVICYEICLQYAIFKKKLRRSISFHLQIHVMWRHLRPLLALVLKTNPFSWCQNNENFTRQLDFLDFKASTGLLDSFKSQFNIGHFKICGKNADVNIPERENYKETLIKK